MSTKKQQVEAETRWKDRYYEVMEQLKSRERDWRETEGLLSQLLNWVAQSADSGNTDLVQQLDKLSKALNDEWDIQQLRTLVSGISAQLTAQDQLAETDEKLQHPGLVFIEVLDKLELPAELEKQYKRLKKKINTSSVEENVSSISNDFIHILEQLLAGQKQGGTQTRKQKVLERILSRAKSADSKNADEQGDTTPSEQIQSTDIPQRFIAPAVGELLLQLALRMPDPVKQRINYVALKKHTNRARRRKDLLPIVDVIAQQVDAACHQKLTLPIDIQSESVNAVSDAVKQLLQQLQLPAELKPQLARLEAFYTEKTTDIDGLIHCLHQLAEIVAEVCHRLGLQRDELQGFFAELGGFVQDLNNTLQQTGEFNQTGHESREQMAMVLQQEIHAIRNSLQSGDDIDELKMEIESGLGTIAKHIEQYHEHEKQRVEQAGQVIAELSNKINQLGENKLIPSDKLEETQQHTLRDVLSGIPNRQAYEQRLNDEFARCRRYEASLSMIVWDIDHFKNVNRSFGHAAGDRVLKVIAELLVNRLRETDFTARYEAGKFVTLMPETKLEDAIRVASKLRNDVEQTLFHFRDSRVPVTLSAGVAEFQKDDLVTALFERAEAALCRAKSAGRNQVRA